MERQENHKSYEQAEKDETEQLQEETLHFDELLITRVGEFGRRQIWLSMLVALHSVSPCIHTLSVVFLAGIPDHWCSVKNDVFSNCTEAKTKQLTIPKEYKDDQTVFSHCQIFHHNYTQEEVADYCIGNGSLNRSDLNSVACNDWHYDTSVYPDTLVSEWNLVCSDAGFASTVAAVFMVGRIVGSLFAGQLIDKFGRRIPLLVSALFFVIVSFLCCVMPNYTSFVVIRLFMSIFLTIRDAASIVLSVELVGPSWRAFVLVISLVFWSCGYLVLDALAFLISDWRYLQAVLTAPDVLFLITFAIFLPESPRWLLVNDKQDEAMKIIRNIAKGNGKILPSNIKAYAQVEEATGTYLDLLKTPAIRCVSFVLFYCWFANAFVYYGLTLNVSNLGGNPYINFLISGAVELPGALYIWWSFAKFGRLRPFGYIFIGAGISLLAIVPVPQDINWLIIVFAMIGKFCIFCSFGMVWIYTLEVFPTSIRALGLNMNASFGRFASVTASYVGLLSGISRELPLLIFGAMALLGGVLVFILPETRDQPMRQTVQEGEEFIQQNLCQFGVCKRFRKDEDQNKKEMEEKNTAVALNCNEDELR